MSGALLLFSQSVRLANRRFGSALGILFLLLIVPALTASEDSKLSGAQRQEIIRAFLAEHPFVHHAIPRGKSGIHIAENGKITPSEAQMNQLIAQFGPAAKPGERAQISAVRFVHNGIVFEINGGPVKHKKWTDHVSVGMGGVDPRTATQTQPTDDSANVNVNGSFVFLAVNDEVAPSLTADHIKDLLAPILDFKAMNVAEAYQKSLPPLLAAAVKNHHALVGMDKDMVTYAMGRPPRRLRESKDGQEYEEWIYGDPPQDVEFVRFLGDKVVSIEDMKVNGEKQVRTQDEVGDLGGTLDASSTKQTRPDSMSAPSSATSSEDERHGAPTLLRPGEKPANTGAATRDPNPSPPPDPTAPPSGPN